MRSRLSLLIRCLLAVSPLVAFAVLARSAPPRPVSYSKQILPLLQKECVACHSGPNAASGYAMDTRPLLLKGGRHGVAVIPGKGARSLLVRYLTGDVKPKMPPGKSLDLDTIALVRRWIDEGAKIDRGVTTAPAAPRRPTAAAPKTTANQPAPVTALAFSPDGATLAAGGYRVVRLLDPASGAVKRTLTGPADQVQTLAWSTDGKLLAAAGGVPGQAGEVVLFDVAAGKLARRLTGHADAVYAVAWKPGGTELASGSLDKTIRIWDAAAGRQTRLLKHHADAVLGVAYSPDGKWLATGSVDRSAKLADTASWKIAGSLTAHGDAVTRVRFNHDGTLLATAGADRTVRIWKVEIGKMENPQRTLGAGDTITDCAFSADGSLFVVGSADRVVRVWNGDGAQHRRDIKDAADWVYSVAVARDGALIAAGTQEGKVLFWNANEGRLLRSVHLLPGGAKIETGTATK